MRSGDKRIGRLEVIGSAAGLGVGRRFLDVALVDDVVAAAEKTHFLYIGRKIRHDGGLRGLRRHIGKRDAGIGTALPQPLKTARQAKAVKNSGKERFILKFIETASEVEN